MQKLVELHTIYKYFCLFVIAITVLSFSNAIADEQTPNCVNQKPMSQLSLIGENSNLKTLDKKICDFLGAEIEMYLGLVNKNPDRVQNLMNPNLNFFYRLYKPEKGLVLVKDEAADGLFKIGFVEQDHVWFFTDGKAKEKYYYYENDANGTVIRCALHDQYFCVSYFLLNQTYMTGVGPKSITLRISHPDSLLYKDPEYYKFVTNKLFKIDFEKFIVCDIDRYICAHKPK